VLLLWVATGQEEEEEEDSWRCGGIAGWRDPDGEARAAGRLWNSIRNLRAARRTRPARNGARDGGAGRGGGWARGRTNERVAIQPYPYGEGRGEVERKGNRRIWRAKEDVPGVVEGAGKARRRRRRRGGGDGGDRGRRRSPRRGERGGGVGPVGVRSEPSLTRAPGLGRLRSESNNRLMDGCRRDLAGRWMDRVGRNWPPKGVIL
jgi:hypothetical protein